jgi:hypothetical protein
LEPGGVSSATVNSESSVSPKKPLPTMPSAGSASAATNVAAARAIIANRWSSAHATTPL